MGDVILYSMTSKAAKGNAEIDGVATTWQSKTLRMDKRKGIGNQSGSMSNAGQPTKVAFLPRSAKNIIPFLTSRVCSDGV